MHTHTSFVWNRTLYVRFVHGVRFVPRLCVRSACPSLAVVGGGRAWGWWCACVRRRPFEWRLRRVQFAGEPRRHTCVRLPPREARRGERHPTTRTPPTHTHTHTRCNTRTYTSLVVSSCSSQAVMSRLRLLLCLVLALGVVATLAAADASTGAATSLDTATATDTTDDETSSSDDEDSDPFLDLYGFINGSWAKVRFARRTRLVASQPVRTRGTQRGTVISQPAIHLAQASTRHRTRRTCIEWMHSLSRARCRHVSFADSLVILSCPGAHSSSSSSSQPRASRSSSRSCRSCRCRSSRVRRRPMEDARRMR